MILWMATAGLLLAVLPAGLFLRNLRLYAPAPPPPPPRPGGGEPWPRFSVLIPARNEEANIDAAIHSVLENEDADFELIVLDDASTDRTAEIVDAIAARDARVRLETAPPLPAGWCGKQHACHTLAHLARNPLLLFVDADVRLRTHALARIARFMHQSGAALASGVPQQQTETFSERLLLPLIHFILLGFLPIKWMRAGRNPAFGAGCGQLFVAQREAYLACDGHRAIGGTMHDGSKLPRVFRAAGFATDLFDATDLAICRMYSSNGEAWGGLARSAHEGLGAPRVIGLATLLLLGGQVVPFLVIAAILLGSPASPLALVTALLGVAAALFPRLIAVSRFRQSLFSAVLHPLGVCALLGIQWFAFFRARWNRPAFWRGRFYFPPNLNPTNTYVSQN